MNKTLVNSSYGFFNFINVKAAWHWREKTSVGPETQILITALALSTCVSLSHYFSGPQFLHCKISLGPCFQDSFKFFSPFEVIRKSTLR